MKCDNCNKAITKIYRYNGQQLGIECYKSLDPFHQDPAQAVYVAAQAILFGDNAPASLLPGLWSKALKTPSVFRYAINLSELNGDGHINAYWLAVSAHGYVEKQSPSPLWSVGEYKRFIAIEENTEALAPAEQ